MAKKLIVCLSLALVVMLAPLAEIGCSKQKKQGATETRQEQNGPTAEQQKFIGTYDFDELTIIGNTGSALDMINTAFQNGHITLNADGSIETDLVEALFNALTDGNQVSFTVGHNYTWAIKDDGFIVNGTMIIYDQNNQAYYTLDELENYDNENRDSEYAYFMLGMGSLLSTVELFTLEDNVLTGNVDCSQIPNESGNGTLADEGYVVYATFNKR